MKSISILLLLLLIAGYADGQDGPVCASTGGVSVDLLVEVLSDEVPYRDKSLLEYPDIRAMIESLNATNGTASLHACWDMARNIGMTAICDDESQDCASLAEYNGQPCESSSLCQGSPDGESFQANCKGVDKGSPDCAINYCTQEGLDSCSASADSGKSKATVMAVMLMTMGGMLTL